MMRSQRRYVHLFTLTTSNYFSIDFDENTIINGMAFSPNGDQFATISTDRKVRVFTFLTGERIQIFDETLARYQEIQKTQDAMPNTVFQKK